MIKGKPYVQPPAVFHAGDKVRFWIEDERDGKTHTVVNGDHCCATLEGFPKAVSNWRLKRVGKRQTQKGISDNRRNTIASPASDR